jgi:serine/threonine-protein kinase
MIGTVIHEQYRILELLGEGGMGVVYKALDLELDRLVALKFLKAEFGDNQLLIKRFRDELKVLASFNHPNITMLYTSFTWQSRPVMVMELLEGEPLNRMIDRRGPIPANVCVPLVRHALAGVGEAHRRGIIHRDLKPANLMLSQSGIVKVMDFGIAKIESSPGLTRTSTTMGTPFYIAPEQIDPERFGLTRADARTDIYSMGVTLYELLAGEVPFKGATEYSIQRAHLEQAPVSPTIFYPHIPAPIVDAVLRAMAKDPAHRFQKAEEFSEALYKVNLETTELGVSAVLPPAISALTNHAATTVPESGTANRSSVSVRSASFERTVIDSATSLPAGPVNPGTVPKGQSPPPPQGASEHQIPTRSGFKGRSPLAVAAIAFAALLLLAAGGFGLMIMLRPVAPPSRSESAAGGGGSPVGNMGQGAPDKGQFHLPQPEAPVKTSSSGNDIPPPIVAPAAKKPLAPRVPPTTIPSTPQAPTGIVSGLWKGRYTNYADNSVSAATLNLSEGPGNDPNDLFISGVLTVQNSSGSQRCTLFGNLDKLRNKLTFRVASCSTGTVPPYLSAHTTILTPSNGLMSGTVDPDMGVVVSFSKM